MSRLPQVLAVRVCLLVLALSSAASAQFTTGRVDGIIRDPSGATVPDVEVSLRSIASNSVRTYVTSADGAYLFTALTPGPYELKVTAEGWQTLLQNVEATSSQTVTQNFTLSLAVETGTLSVEADAVALNATDAQLSVTRNANEVANLPNLNRNVISLVSLAPGVQPTFNPRGGTLTVISGAQAGQIAANGGRARATSVQLDSTDANDWEFGGFALGTQPTPDMLQEFKLISNNFTAEYGVKSNAQLVMITRSGSNALHGSAYDYLQNNVLNARDYFDRTGQATPLKKNNFGATTGGPVYRNRTFFFAGWEESRTRGAGFTSLASVPSTAARNRVTDPAVQQLLQRFLPQATASTADPNVGTVASQFGSPSNGRSIIAKIDHHFSDRHILSGRYWYGRGDSLLTFPSYNTLPGYDSDFQYRSQNVNLTDTWVASSRTTNELRLAYGRSSAQLLTQNGDLAPRFSITNLVNFGPLNFFPQGRIFNVYQVNDVMTHVAGAHTFKFGADIRQIQDNSSNDTNRRGLIVFSSLDSFLAGQPSVWTQLAGNSYRGFRTGLAGLFVQDDWRVTPSLTLNLGLRWEIQGALSEVNGLISTLDLNSTAAMGNAGPGPLGSLRTGSTAVDWRPRNAAPRLGFAWNPRQGGIVVRGGYGIVWDSFSFTPLANARTQPPLNYTVSLTGTQLAGANSLSHLLDGTAPVIQQAEAQIGGYGDLRNFGSITATDPSLRNPYVQQFNLSVEKRLGSSSVFGLSYVGTKATHLTRVVAINPLTGRPAAATSTADEQARLAQFQSVYARENGVGNARLDPRFDQVNYHDDGGSSIYHAMQAEFRHRWSRRLNLQASYTWSKSIDDASDFNTPQQANDYGFAQDQNQRASDRAVSNFDVTHRVIVTGVWDLPFFAEAKGLRRTLLGGWSFQSVNQWQSGIPATILAGARYGISDVNLDGNLVPTGTDNTRASCVYGGQPFEFGNAATIPAVGLRGVNGASNSANFLYTQPLLGNNGTCGRNTFRMNHLTNFDWSFFKSFQLAERGPLESGPWDVQFRAELFNVFNTPFLTATGDSWRTVSSPAFGLYNSAGAARRVQFALKLLW